MFEYVLILLVAVLAAVVAFLLHDRYRGPRSQVSSQQYTQALKDLLDGRPESAFAKLRQVVTEDSKNIDAYIRLGQILRQYKQPERALQVHKDLTLRDGLPKKDKAAILRQLSLDYIVLNDFATARKALDELLSVDSQDRWTYERMLEVLEKEKNWDEAYEVAGKLLKLESGKSRKPLARYKYEMGRHLSGQREYHKARLAFKEAISIDPEFVDAYLEVGDAYAAEERFEDAVTFWNKLIEAVPSEGHQVLGRLQKTLFELGRFGDMVDICERILSHDGRNSRARLTLATFYEKKGDSHQAIEILESLFDDFPSDAVVILELARLYMRKGDSKKIDALLRTIERNRERFGAGVGERPTASVSA